jgi:hypothetical protein
MRKLIAFLGLATVACLLAWGWLHQPAKWDILHQTSERPTTNLPVGVLMGEQSGYLLTPPEFVAQPFIRRIEWSPDGNYAVLFQTALRAETPTLDDAVMRHRVLLWNRKTRRLSVLWESAQTDREVNPNRGFQVAFVGKAPLCLFAVRVWDEAEQDDLWKAYVATIGGQVKLLGEYREAWLLAPPAEDIGYILVAESENLLYKRMYAPVGANGILANFQPVPEDLDITTLYAYSARRGNPDLWYEDGKQMLLSSFGPPIAVPEADGVQYRVEPVYSLWNLRTNQVQPIDNARARYYRVNRETLLHARSERHSLQHAGNPAETSTTWLHENERAVLVASDSALAEVAPQGDAILYVAHGAAFYREIRRTSADAIREMQARADREQYLKNAKQIAIALLMYVTDYDEMFPPNFGDEGVSQVLLPYLKNPSVFEVDGAFAFRYRMDGQSLADIESPVTTEVGYLELPNGRMVIYADGHVKWIPYR